MLEDIVREMVQLFRLLAFHIGVMKWSQPVGHCTVAKPICMSTTWKTHRDAILLCTAYAQILNKFGKTMVGWDEIMEGGSWTGKRPLSLPGSVRQHKGGYRADTWS